MPHGLGVVDDWTIAAMREFGDAIRQVRRHHGGTQRGLARRSGISQSTISRLETGLAPGMCVVWVSRLLAAMQEDLVSGAMSTGAGSSSGSWRAGSRPGARSTPR